MTIRFGRSGVPCAWSKFGSGARSLRAAYVSDATYTTSTSSAVSVGGRTR